MRALSGLAEGAGIARAGPQGGYGDMVAGGYGVPITGGRATSAAAPARCGARISPRHDLDSLVEACVAGVTAMNVNGVGMSPIS